MLDETGLFPDVLHINEGHASLAFFERIKIMMKKYGINYEKAYELNKKTSVFTTHTPVVHGNEEFEPKHFNNYLQDYFAELKMNITDVRKFSSIDGRKAKKIMMTLLGLKMAGFTNGVSRLHGDTASKMWQEVPNINIGYITNGIHLNTWLSSEMQELLRQFTGIDPFSGKLEDVTAIDQISDHVLRDIKNGLKLKLLNYVNHRYKLNIKYDNNFIIGFARRFARYKQADMIFKDSRLLEKVFKDPRVILFIAGKAHPKDTDGRQILRHVINSIKTYGLEDQVFFLENYDIELGKKLVQGTDAWLNTPLRPMEACGTSGMKAAVNAGINISIPDGWWEEAYNGNNGFMIAKPETPEDKQLEEISKILSEKLIPMYYSEEEKEKAQYANIMREAVKTTLDKFNSFRMFNEYHKKYYKNALENMNNFVK